MVVVTWEVLSPAADKQTLDSEILPIWFWSWVSSFPSFLTLDHIDPPGNDNQGAKFNGSYDIPLRWYKILWVVVESDTWGHSAFSVPWEWAHIRSSKKFLNESYTIWPCLDTKWKTDKPPSYPMGGLSPVYILILFHRKRTSWMW